MSTKYKPKYTVEELEDILKELIEIFNMDTTVNNLVKSYRNKKQPALLQPKIKND